MNGEVVQKLETIVVAGLLVAPRCVVVKCKQLYARYGSLNVQGSVMQSAERNWLLYK
jgi:hypothetical protein